MMQTIAKRSATAAKANARRAFSNAAAAEAGKERLVLFDTTLRDGEQSPGATLNFKEKLDIARALSTLGVDVCEAGFPISSPGDFDAVSAIAKEIGPITAGRPTGEPMTICGLARAMEKDIQRCYDAVKHAPKHRIHTFLATSDIHLQYKLKISRDECIRRAVDAVKFAKSLTPDVEFSTEDAGRSDPDFLCDVLAEVIKAGATTLNIPDTVGYTVPGEYGSLFSYLIDNTEGSDKAIFSTHCHNDLGLATANTLAAVQGGARQAEVTINGIGERAGNTALEELVMALKTRPQHFPVYTSVDSTQITRCSRMVSHYTGMSIQPNKAIVGSNAFAHESGIHQDGVLKHQATYEIMLPESVGLSENKMVLGKHSGRHAYSKRLQQLGYTNLTPEELDYYVEKFKVLADEKKTVTDADMEAIVSDELFKPETFWTLQSVHVTAGNLVKPTATVTLAHKDGQEVSEAAMGTGPIDAIYVAIKRATGMESIKLNDFSVESVTDGTYALGEVTVRVQEDKEEEEKTEGEKHVNAQTGVTRDRQFVGHGANTDILVASATAYVNAVNRMMASQSRAGAEGRVDA
ncbi:2-isopropylmalate synthase [Phytophthora infestans T30-4]|uniref:2-isopropylmalate synthase n=3 Tax=Phytophthora infestans TaxID=4787 RepID=D0MYD7_PHYIT|nr:2-isopropylmalate synthase [Phytophthora infestans T30-4]EEY66185.1 2-isopropylmalate synthase [Phytophthora infestans T30-4]KAF4040523.1 LeuA allosteric (dimerization) domain [Phytophthora infestans]KAF4135767.1 LeuA allosteric (dimerization) domain [Phytophthora infestans]|eukprot:XP_002906784.1 2-isopropylmalate synthase [Phytophthora infestans T30-4]